MVARGRPNNTRTPNWDIASTCTIEGKAGILLIEAKAHDQELIKEETGRKNIETPVSGNARRNLLRIDWAIRDASAALAEETGLTWALSGTGTTRCRTVLHGPGS